MKNRFRLSVLSVVAIGSLLIGATSVLASFTPSSSIDPIRQFSMPSATPTATTTETVEPTQTGTLPAGPDASATPMATETSVPGSTATPSTRHDNEQDDTNETPEATRSAIHTPEPTDVEVEIHSTQSTPESVEHHTAMGTKLPDNQKGDQGQSGWHDAGSTPVAPGHPSNDSQKGQNQNHSGDSSGGKQGKHS